MTIRRLVAGFAAAMMLSLGLISVSSPAAAAAEMSEGFHWDNLLWNGTAYSYRSVFIIDRSNDATVTTAIHEVIDNFNNISWNNGQWGVVPILQYLDQNAYAYAGCDGMTSVIGYSFMSVCSGGPANGFSQTVFGSGHAAETGDFHPHLHIDRYYSGSIATFNAVYHEVLHGLGVGHSTDCNDLMGGYYEAGCKLPTNVRRYPTGNDINPMTYFYWSHPMNV